MRRLIKALWTWRFGLATTALVLLEAAGVTGLVLTLIEGRYGLAAILLATLLLLWLFAALSGIGGFCFARRAK